jgi:hypothetical protein
MTTITDDTLIRDLPLSTRAKHALMHGYHPTLPYYNYERTFGEVKALSDQMLLRTSGFGLTSLREWVSLRDAALGLAPSHNPALREVVTPFENIVRPIIGDAYDTAFPTRRKEVDASLTSNEESMIQALSKLYSRAMRLEVEEVRTKVLHGLAVSLKSMRLNAELRKKKAEIVAKRIEVPVYRYRVTAPDGTELLYPARGTIHTNRKYAQICRRVPKPVDQIEETIKRYYEHHLNKSQSEDHTAKLHAAIARDIETEIRLQSEMDLDWWLSDFSARRSTLERDAQRWKNGPTQRWHYEHLIVEGIPFNIDEEETDQ